MSEASIYETLFDAAPAGMALLDAGSAQVRLVNRAFADTIGYERAALDGRAFGDVCKGMFSMSPAEFENAFESAARGDSSRLQCRMNSEGGDPIEVAIGFEPLTHDGREHVLATVQPLSGESGSRRSEEPNVRPGATASSRAELALELANIGIWEWDVDTGEISISRTMEQLGGFDPDGFDGTFESFLDRVHPADIPPMQEEIQRAIEEENFYRAEYRFERPDGNLRWFEARGKMLTDGDQRRLIGAITDITERKTHQEVVHERERQYRELVDRLPAAYYTLDADWNIAMCNEVLADRHGETVEEMIGRNLWTEYPALEDTIVAETLHRTMADREPASCEYHWESHDRWLEIKAFPYEEGIAVVSIDITSRKEKLSLILDSMPLIIFRLDTDGVVREARGNAISKLGLMREELVGSSIFDVYGDNPTLIDAGERALRGEEVRRRLDVDNQVLETKLVPIFEDGEVTDVSGVAFDVTELERQRTQLEFFNSILRHDVLNGMTVIKMRGEVLAEQLEGEQGQYAETIVNWADQVTAVTDRIRQVLETLTTLEEDLALTPIDVTAILERKVRDLAAAYPEVTFDTDLEPGAYALADELLADALGNVLSNSIEHNETADLVIDVAVESTPETVLIAIADTGRGIPDDRKQAIFRRGESSSAKESGSGFGLFFASVLIEKYDGTIHVEDSESGGARFVVELPRAGED